jgi:hypothetical protein
MNKLTTKLDILINDSTLREFDNMVELINTGFDSKDDLHHHLTEGAILNVGILASKALAIPHGEYMVWMSDAGHTMLVPTKATAANDVMEHQTEQYDIFTNTLLQNWNKISKTLTEDEKPEESSIAQNIDIATVDRKPIVRAMQDRGFTVTSLARAVGVDPPAISRILRKPKDVQGDPQGRNPSMGLASQICTQLRLDPTSAFPDIFGDKSKYRPKAVKGNRGSGSQGGSKGVEGSPEDDE